MNNNKCHIPLERRFASPSETELRDPNYWSDAYLDTYHRTCGWDDILERQHTVVLGEGRCGKTHEFKQQVERLRKDGKFAFFVPIERLRDYELEEDFQSEDIESFRKWEKSDGVIAYFFLDAVDELKMQNGSFRAALKKFKKAIELRLTYTKMIISCRPRDWDNEIDLTDVNDFQVPQNVQEQSDSDIAFKRKKEEPESIKVLALLPLNRAEIVEFAGLYDHLNAEKLEKEFEKNELWHLYQVPADIAGALDKLKSDGQLGTFEEQLNFGIGQKLKEVSGNKPNSLSLDRAREGAERVALAMSLMKKRSIQLNKVGAESDDLDIGHILNDWSLDEKKELLGKSLFDITGVDAVKFHHRSIQEYLGAKHLQNLKSAGLPTKDLRQLLFQEISNERVIVPSMEPVAAWLAIWGNADILKEVKERNPLLLFKQGLPASMSIELREDLLRCFVEQFKDSDWRNVGLGYQELKRMAHEDLSPIVRELWDAAYKGHETRELLLQLMCLTPMADCSDLAFNAAFDEEIPKEHRIYACWAVSSAGNNNQKTDIVTSILGGTWPERVVLDILKRFFPDTMSIDDFLTIARRLTGGSKLAYALKNSIINAIKLNKLTREEKITICQRLTTEVWNNRQVESTSTYDHFTKAIVICCEETIPKNSIEINDWAWSLAVAFHFNEREEVIFSSDETNVLQLCLKNTIPLKEAYFWARFELIEELQKPENDWHRYCDTTNLLNMGEFSDEDRPWLLKALGSQLIENRRGVALYALTGCFAAQEKPEFIEQVRALISDRTDLIEILEQKLNPAESKADKYNIIQQERKSEQKIKNKKIAEEWKKWCEDVLAASDFLLTGDQRLNTLFNIQRIIKKEADDNDSWSKWDANLVAETFSLEFLARYRKEISKYWRGQEVALWSERDSKNKGSFLSVWSLALMGLKSEAETTEWANTLTPDDAILAVRISTVELNGFASFIGALDEFQPAAVEEVIGGEVTSQLTTLASDQRAPILSEVFYHGTPMMLKSAAHAIASNLSYIIPAITDNTENDLACAFKIIAKYDDKEIVAETVDAIEQYLNDPILLDSEKIPFLLNSLAQLDVEMACEKILNLTECFDNEEQREAAITMFAATFGDQYFRGNPGFDKVNITKRPELLKRLVIRAYQVIRRQDDANHEESYTPDRRDRAERAREYLFGSLIGTKTQETLPALYELSNHPEFTHMKDRLKQMAIEIAAQICDPDAMTAATFNALDQEKEYVPYDVSSLFTVMKNRLEDFEHDLLKSEFVSVDTIRKITKETELRTYIAGWLNVNRRKAYSVNQEAIKAGGNFTDIRLQASQFSQHAIIELKLDDQSMQWSGKNLEDALRDQLVGKYLLDETLCQVGCLLICMREERNWKNPDTQEKMNLKETVSWLQQIANEICLERPNLRLLVKGIDYSESPKT